MSRKNKKRSDSPNQDQPEIQASSPKQLFFDSFAKDEKRLPSSVGNFVPITVEFKLSEMNRLFWLANSLTFRQAAVRRLSEWESRLLNGEPTEKTKDRDKKGTSRKKQADENSANSAQSMNRSDIEGEADSVPEFGSDEMKNKSSRWMDLVEAFGVGDQNQDSIEQAMVCLGAACLLPRIVEAEGEDALQELIDPLVAQAGQFRLASAEGGAQLWLEQVLGVELPLVLARSFPDLVVDADWCEPAVDWMSSMIYENLDEQGWPKASLLPIFGPLMASWLRCWRMMENTDWVFGESVVQQFHGAIRCLLRLVRSNGQLMFSDFNSSVISEECFHRMVQILKKQGDRKFAKQISDVHKADSLSGRSGQSRKKKHVPAEVKSRGKVAVKPNILSEWGSGSVFRGGWHSSGAKIACCFSQREFHCEIDAAKPLIFGTAMPTIRFQGKDILPIDEFDVVCEESDVDVHYLELQMAMSDQITLTRQVLHLYPDDVLLIADCIVPHQSGKIEYGCEWPISAGISVLPETETREVYLQKDKIESLVLPVSLPEWLIGPTTGNLRHNPINNRLQMTDSIEGAGLYVPLVFDLCPKRSRKKRTWRRLTVAEGRQPLDRDLAAAYRFQLDKEQWFFYRTVSSKGSRTFFGEHFNGEFVIGKFGKDGSVKELLRIE